MKFRSILYGSGKAGNIVGAKGYNGEYTIRVHVPHINQPNTLAQLTQRAKASVVTKTLSPIAPWAKMLHLGNGKRSGWSQLIKWNFPEAISGTYPNFELDFSKTLIANGNIDLPYSPSAAADGTTLTLTWADNSGMGDALASDSVMALALNTDKGQAVYNTDLADRATRNATMALPTAWSGDSVEVWLAMRRSNGDTSRSTHLATLPL